VVAVATAVEHDLRDTRALGTVGDELADLGRTRLIAALADAAREAGLEF